jgi:hypothetical protein
MLSLKKEGCIISLFFYMKRAQVKFIAYTSLTNTSESNLFLAKSRQLF